MDARESTEVVVVGAGPTGLMLACELALAGVRCRVLERREGQSNITRAFAVHARTLELLDARGLADDLVPHGVPVRRLVPTPGTMLDLGEFDTRYQMVLIAPQSGTEHLLEARQQRADYVVGCDGSHSGIRRMVGVDFVGKQYETHILLADVLLTTPPAEAMFTRNNNDGVVLCVPFGDGWYRVLAWDRLREQAPLEPVTSAEMRDAFRRIAGTDFGMSEPRWSSRFLSERRQARHYRVGRVFLAGDAAHVHSPMGGQGMNTGIQDAMNLGWKLAGAVHGWAPRWLLDSYEGERHPVGATVLQMTDAFNRMMVGHSRPMRLLQRFVISSVLRLRRPRLAVGGRLTGLGIAYPAREPGAHPWTGRRMPDVRCADGRLYELLRDGRFVLVRATDTAEDQQWSDRVRSGYREPGSVSALPTTVLVRPDGYVAWAADNPTNADVDTALSRWCGPATFARLP
jgi:2-polyprenyl-6-methoxyphenol hydroxylase-like FAD-dependent oxidoreductase